MTLPNQRFHINGKGETGVCSALIQCRFGGSENHYASAPEAREAYGAKMAAGLVPPPLLPDSLSYEQKQARLHSMFMGRLPEKPSEGYADVVYEEESGEDMPISARPDLSGLLRKAKQVADENPWRDVGVGASVHHNMHVATRMGKASAAGEFLRARALETPSEEARAFYTVMADHLTETNEMLF